jgi:hypothetical protein
VTQRYEPTFEADHELVFEPTRDGCEYTDPDTRRFSMVEPFEVDGIWYDPSTRSNIARLIVQCIPENHQCFNSAYTETDPETCLFEGAADRETLYNERLSPAYRWRPGMVYYRATEFRTPIHGG